MYKLGDIVKNELVVIDFIVVFGFLLFGGVGLNNVLGIVVFKDWEERMSFEFGLCLVLICLMG